MNKGNKKAVYGIAAVAVVAVIVLAVVFLMPKSMSINPTDYVKVKCGGLNGEGKASLTFDADSFLTAIKAEKELKPAQESEIEGLLAKGDQYFKLSKNSELTNGDKISIECDMPSDFLKSYKVKIENKTFEYTVAGLIDMQMVDLGSYAVIEFTGFEGHGYINATLDYEKMYQDVSQMVRNVEESDSTESYITNDLYSALYRCVSDITASENEALCNGDQITVTYNVNEEYGRIEKYGIIFESAQREVKVEGLEPVEKVDLADYLKAEFSGYDGVGRISVSIDEEKMREDFAEKFADTRNGYTAEDVVYQVENYIDYNVILGADKTDYIVNGEEIRIFAQIDEEQNYIFSVGIEIEGAETTVTAQGLEEPQEVDLTELLTVSFSGICPDVEVEVSIEKESPLYGYIDRNSYQSIPRHIYAQNGESLDITLEYYEENALRAGYKVTNNTQSYEISGLDKYDFDLESLDQEEIDAIVTQGKQEVKQTLLDGESDLMKKLEGGSGWILWNQVKVGLNKVVKVYADRAYYDFNRTAFVYEACVPIMQQNETVTQNTVYVLTYFENVTQSPDGSLNFGDRERYVLYYSEESLQEELAKIPDWLDREEGSECEQSELYNETIEEEIKFEELSKATAQEQERLLSSDTEDAVIPEISEEAAGSAAAVIEYEGHRYYRFDTAVTWKEAKALCEKAGGQLVSITSWTEQSVLQNLIKEGSLSHYWIGATDEEMEGNWSWVSGEDFCYDGWDDNQPDNYDNVEDYAYISRSFDSCWNDDSNETEGVGYILEVSAQQDNGQYLPSTHTLIHQKSVSYDAWDDNSYGNRSYGVIAYNASDSGWTQYQLNGAYEKLTGEVSIYSEAASGVSMDFAVFGDGQLLYRQTAITRQTIPTSFALDVSGIKVLTIETRNLGETSSGWLLLGNAKLYAHEGETETPNAARLGDLVIIDSKEMQSETKLFQDAFGGLHDSYLRFNAYYNSSMVWNLDEKYTTFSGKFVAGKSTGSKVAIKVQIYGDEELLFESDGYDKTKDAIEFSIDVTGKQVLRIVTEDALSGSNSYLYLVDDLLTAQSDAAQTEQENEEKMTDWNDVEENAYQFPELSSQVSSQISAMAEYGTHRYYLIETPMTWKGAEEFCEKAGGHLAVITSLLEQERVTKLLKNAQENDYWIGASDEAEEGNFVWVSKEAMTYTNWKNGEPSNSDKGDGITESYMEIYANSGLWNDNDDQTHEFGFVMEISDDRDSLKETQDLGELALNGKLTESSAYEYDSEISDSHGNTYLSSYSLNASNEGYVTYDLNGEYTKISGILSPYSRTEQNASMNIGFFGDGKLLYGKSGISGWQEACKFEIDVTGVKTLTIKTSNTGDYNNGWVLLNDMTLTLAQTPEPCSSAVRLKDLQLIDSAEMEYHVRLSKDTFGTMYENDYSFDASDNGYALYLLGGKYTQFSGVVCPGKATKSDNVIKVEIYADDELVFEQDGITRMTKAVPFTVDVTGRQNLKIVTSDSSESYESYVYLTEDFLQ
ncbi:MAG: NPCBM/NEW2 domain-containing protein [Lachnospiraceae bacterium]|nr:NPCBM/NEW2 domain-containing protein [Robinsoniella sp.]MDY3767180.1 NPCBM/NEW2 domain-containing protein [Lachnospiraceae bacterium]